MAKVPMTAKLTRLHKKFTFGNLIFMIIAVIALAAQLFMPFLDFRIHVKGENLAPALQQSSSSEESGDVTEVLASTLEDVELDIPVNLYPFKLFKAATGTEADVVQFLNSTVGDKGSKEFADQMVDSLSKPLLKAGMHVAINQSIDQSNLTEEQKKLVEEHKEDLDAVIENLCEGSPESIEKAKNGFTDTAKDIAQVNGNELSEADIADLHASFDDVVDLGKLEDGSFDVTEMLKNFNTEALEGGSDAEAGAGDDAEVDENTENTEETDKKGGALEGIIKVLENPGQTIFDSLKKSGMETKTLQTVFLVLFIVMVGLPAFFWALFALSAFIHLFTKKKMIRTGYVFFFCIWGGLGVILGNVCTSVLLPKILAEAGAGSAAGASTMKLLSAFTFKFLGSGIVTGICWLALVVCNFLFYRPTRKRVKRETKRIKQLVAAGYEIEADEFSIDDVDPLDEDYEADETDNSTVYKG